MRPILILQQSNRDRIQSLREGLGDLTTVVPLGIEKNAFWSLAGLDALYLSLTMAERWGSKPIPPHTAMVLRTRDEDLSRGYPPFVVSGLLLNKGEPDTGRFGVPLVIAATIRAAKEFNKQHGNPIRIIGFFERELSYDDINARELGELIRAAYEEVVPNEHSF
jgi:hypothetical protein